MTAFRILLAAMLSAAFTSLGVAQAPSQSPAPPPSAAASAGHPSEISISDTRRISFVSKVNGHRYSLSIALPDSPPPPNGYPVLYVLDGDAYFGTAVEASRSNDNAPQAIVVGIGYPHDAEWPETILSKHKPLPKELAGVAPFWAAMTYARLYDMSLPLNGAQLKEVAVTLPLGAGDVGGMDEFLKIIETEVKPRVYALTQVNREDQTLFGHSVGGLTVVDALFTEPQAFRTFVAASPSIWWGDKEVLEREAGFSARVNAGEIAPRVLITVGGEEEAVPKLPPELASKKDEIEALVKKDRMVGNACELAKRLQALHGGKGYEVADCAVFPHQSHGISYVPAIGRAISFAYPE